MFKAMRKYCAGIYQSRYFWWNLTLADLRFKYRRSTLGILWSVFQPLAMTLLLSFIMGRFFKMPMHYLAPYIFIGMVTWELLLSTMMTGCNALINAESYIKLFKHPMAIYPLRSVLAVYINFLCGSVGAVGWALVAMPENFSWSYLALIPAGLIIFFWCWSAAITCAFAGVRFVDLPQLLVIVMQMIWYASPVFFPLDLFRGAKIGWLLNYNPVYHLLELLRQPLLHGNFPALIHWVWSLGVMLLLMLLAMLAIRIWERRTIYYF